MYLQEGWFDERPRSFQIYTPARTVVVYGLVKDEEKLIQSIEISDVIDVDDELAETAEPIDA